MEVTQPASGKYQVSVLGKSFGEYEISLTGVNQNAETNLKNKFFGVTEAGRMIRFKLLFEKSSGGLSEIVKEISFITLKDDLRLAWVAGYIENKGIYAGLLSKLESAEMQNSKGKRATAINILNAIEKELKAQSGKQINMKFVDFFVADILEFRRYL